MLAMNLPDDPERGAGAKSFVEHLDDLRRTLVRCLLFATAGMAVAIPLSPLILDIIKQPLEAAGRNPDEFLKVMDVTGGMVIAMKISLWGGLLLASPFMAWAIAWFVFPGLTAAERKVVFRGVFFSVFLFLAGASMCYWFTLPLAMRFMFHVNDLMRVDCAFVNVADYAGVVLSLLLAFGLAFQFPIIIMALGALGLINSGQLRDKRRHAIVIIFIVSMILTPPDVGSQVLMAIPLIGLYEICIWLLRSRERRKEAETAGRA
jgi:sec-independent protein translocase protein TatC